MTGRHPGHDVLADLAAEVLPDGEARVVEAHVIGCSRCADLLADAERVRQLLMTADPGPMPEQVWERIAGSLAQQSVSPPGRPAGQREPTAESSAPTEPWITASWPAAVDWPPPDALPTGGPAGGSTGGPDAGPVVQEATTGQWQQFAARTGEQEPAPDQAFDRVSPSVQAAPDLGSPDLGSLDLGSPDLDRGRPDGSVRPIRRGATSLRSRRQIRSEDRTMSLLRYVRPLGIAAAVLVLAGAAGLAVVKLPLGGSGSELGSTAAGGAASQPNAEADRGENVPQEPAAAADAAGTLTVASGTNYTEQDLAEKASMLTPSKRVASASAGQSTATAGRGELGLPSVSGNASLTDPVNLAECLAELNAGDDVQPIAVDFARYQGQDAAIIVIAARDGGYEVWAVARTCGAGSGGQLAFQTFSP